MKRKLLSLLLASSMVLTLAACGGSGSESGEAGEVIPQEVSPTLVIEPEPDLIEEIEVTWPGDLLEDRTYTVSAAGGFHDGLAWIKFSGGSDDYIGCIDKDGVLQFYCDGAYDYSDFEDGYAYLRGDDELYWIDAAGEIVHDYTQELSGETIVNYYDGYVVSYHEESSFSTGTTKIYTLTDSSGNQTPYESKSKADVQISDFLSAYGLKLEWEGVLFELGEEMLGSELALSLGEDVVYLARDEQGAWYFIMYDSSTGGFTKAALPVECEELYYQFAPITAPQDGFISFLCADDIYSSDPATFYILDVSTGALLKYEGKYADYVPSVEVIADMFSILSCRVGDKFILPLVGADGNPYFVFLDEDMNELTEPAQAKFLYVDGDYLFWDDGVYDLDGNFLRDGDSDRLMSAIERNVFQGDCMSEGVIRDTVGGTYTYYAYDGTLLFDENGINYSRAALIELPSAD